MAEMKTFSLLQLGEKRSVVEIDGVIKLGNNYNLSVIASLRGYTQLARLFMEPCLTESWEEIKRVDK